MSGVLEEKRRRVGLGPGEGGGEQEEMRSDRKPALDLWWRALKPTEGCGFYSE